jgi:hypothetical protein
MTSRTYSKAEFWLYGTISPLIFGPCNIYTTGDIIEVCESGKRTEITKKYVILKVLEISKKG